MSKLVKRLEKLARGMDQPPMGFGFHAAQSKTPALLTLCLLDKENPKAAAAAASAGADFIAVPISPDNLKDAAAILKAESATCGAFCQGLGAEHLPALKEAGCDFLVFEPQQAPMAALRDEDVGKVLVLDHIMEDSLAATAEQLNVDAILLDLGDPPLTVQRVMVFQRTAGLTSKPVLAVVPVTLSSAEVEVLRDLGVQGLAVRVKDVKSAEAIAGLRKTADGIAPPKKKKLKATAILPKVAVRAVAEEEEEEEEGDE